MFNRIKVLCCGSWVWGEFFFLSKSVLLPPTPPPKLLPSKYKLTLLCVSILLFVFFLLFSSLKYLLSQVLNKHAEQL